MDFSEQVKKARMQLVVSQAEFAELMGVTFATVNRWENRRSKPTYRVLRKFYEICKKNKIEIGD